MMYLLDTKNAEGIGVPLSGIVSNVYAMRRDVLVIKVTNDFIALFCNKLRNRIRRRKSKSGEAHVNAMCKQFGQPVPIQILTRYPFKHWRDSLHCRSSLHATR